jgi:hypothetical protein
MEKVLLEIHFKFLFLSELERNNSTMTNTKVKRLKKIFLACESGEDTGQTAASKIREADSPTQAIMAYRNRDSLVKMVMEPVITEL